MLINGLKMICIVIKGPSLDEVYQQIRKASEYRCLIELRLDYFLSRDYASLKKLRAAFSVPMIFTLRSKLHGGNYSQTEDCRLAEIRSLADLKPEYLDLEHTTSHSLIDDIATHHPEIKLILSYHNFLETPKNLDNIYYEMKKVPASFYKVAVTAKNSIEALQLLCWAKNRSDNTLIPISMGGYGQITRVLGPVVGTPITYASLDDDQQTALGQLTAKILIERFRFPFLNLNTRIYGLIGDPVTQSISDDTHNSLFSTCGLNAIYVKIQLSQSELGNFLHLAKKLPFHGLSVTMPLKEVVIQHLDELDPKASDIGAVNTLLFQEEKLMGFNTDGKGALDAIEKKILVKNKRIVIIGAGGAAKAIAYEACLRGGIVTIINRSPQKAQQIAKKFQCKTQRLAEMADCERSGYDILINCTPNPLPIHPQYILKKSLIMDIKTTPEKISLLHHAKEKECLIINGYEMFVEQALGQFILWFGDRLPTQECAQTLKKESIKWTQIA